MLAAFNELKIGPMMPGEGALRVGVLYDLLGRGSQHDKRDETVRLYSKRYAVDTQQAARVNQLAIHFYHQLTLDPDLKAEMIQTLGWAADLHEIGISITHDNYHKHGAYILQHADMPGFSNDDQALLASFVLAHQTKIKQLKVKEASREKWSALLCLRLAVLLLRKRQTPTKIPLRLENDGNAIRLHVSKAWMDAHPLTEYSLHNEIREWTGAGFTFKLIEN